MPPQLATYMTWGQLTGKAGTTLKEFHDHLSQYQRSKVISLCAMVNSLLTSSHGSALKPEDHSELLRHAFPPIYSEKMIQRSLNRAHPEFVFHRQQLLFVAKQAIQHCTENGLDPLALEYWGKFGVVFLMANDHLGFSPAQGLSEEDEFRAMLPSLVLVNDYAVGYNRYAHRLVRSHLMYTKLAQALREHSQFFDIAVEFENLTGLPLLEYQALCFGALSKYMKANLANFRADPGILYLSAGYFRNVAISPANVDRFLYEISGTADEIESELGERDSPLLDFTCFRNRPLFRDGDRLLAIDPAMLAEKIETGPFWRVHASLPTHGARVGLHAFWGAVFEEYLRWLLSESVDGKLNVYYHSPRYARTGEEVCDAIIKCGSSVLLIEYKGSTFTAQAKYSGDANMLEQEIRKKLVNADGEKKGVTQLADAIRRVFSRQDAEPIAGVDISSVKKVFPVLVTRDDIGGAMGINYLLNEQFTRLLRKRELRPRIIIPLHCLTADDVEYISAYLKSVKFSEVLDGRYATDNSFKTPFSFNDNPVLTPLGLLRNDALKREFEQLSNDLVQVMLPGSPPLPDLRAVNNSKR